MSRYRWVVVAVGALMFISSVFGGALLVAGNARQAARSGTSAAIAAAEAKQNSQQAQQAIAGIAATQAGVESLLRFVSSYQSGTQANRSAVAARWYVAEFQSICAAVHCRQVPPPANFP